MIRVIRITHYQLDYGDLIALEIENYISEGEQNNGVKAFQKRETIRDRKYVYGENICHISRPAKKSMVASN